MEMNRGLDPRDQRKKNEADLTHEQRVRVLYQLNTPGGTPQDFAEVALVARMFDSMRADMQPSVIRTEIGGNGVEHSRLLAHTTHQGYEGNYRYSKSVDEAADPAFYRAYQEAVRAREANIKIDVQARVNTPEWQKESAKETVRLYQDAKTSGDRLMWLHDMKYGAEAHPVYRDEVLRIAPELAAKAGVQAREGAELQLSERRVVSEFYSQVNEAFAEIYSRHPADQRQAERIIDGHMAQLQSALGGLGASAAVIQGEAQRARSYVEDKLDEMGVPHAERQRANVIRHEGVRPLSGEVVQVSGRDVVIERSDKSVVAVEAARLDRTPQVGERVMVTFNGGGNGTVRSLGERGQERGASYDMGR